MKTNIYIFGILFFLLTTESYFWINDFCFRIFSTGALKLSCPVLLHIRLLPVFNINQQMNIFSKYSIFRMNALIFFLCVILLYSLYFLALAIAWYKSRQNRIQRGNEGLPDIDSHQAPRSYLRIFGDLCYTALLFLCRLFPQN